jgi:hypothetical protein
LTKFLKYVQLLMFDWVKKKINVFQYTIIYKNCHSFGHIVGGIWQDEDGTRRSPHFTWAPILIIFSCGTTGICIFTQIFTIPNSLVISKSPNQVPNRYRFRNRPLWYAKKAPVYEDENTSPALTQFNTVAVFFQSTLVFFNFQTMNLWLIKLIVKG